MELCFNRPLAKGTCEGPSQPFHFDILSSWRTSLLELPYTSSSSFLRRPEMHSERPLADAKVFLTQILPGLPEEEQQSLYVSTRITFSPEDIHVLGKHDRPLYFTGYLGSTDLNHILVDSGSALSIMPRRVMQYLRIPTNLLSSTDTMIYGINANDACPLEKIRLKCRIGDLKSEVTFYIMDAKTSYNLLLERLCIHCNHVIPSTLHQVMK